MSLQVYDYIFGFHKIKHFQLCVCVYVRTWDQNMKVVEDYDRRGSHERQWVIQSTTSAGSSKSKNKCNELPSRCHVCLLTKPSQATRHNSRWSAARLDTKTWIPLKGIWALKRLQWSLQLDWTLSRHISLYISVFLLLVGVQRALLPKVWTKYSVFIRFELVSNLMIFLKINFISWPLGLIKKHEFH